MVSRIDIDRIRAWRDQLQRDLSVMPSLILWDSGPVHDLMERPKARIHFPEFKPFSVIYSYSQIMQGRAEALRMLEPALQAGRRGDDPAELLREKDPYTNWYVPEHYIFSPDGGDSFAVYGKMYGIQQNSWTIEAHQFNYIGEPYAKGTMQWQFNAPNGVKENRLEHEHSGPEWDMISADAQMVQWCVTYPERFPILRERLAARVDKMPKQKQKAVKKMALPDVQILELRPRITVNGSRPATPTGQHRDPAYSFKVREHPRQLKSGKVVYVKEHWKAVDKPRIDRLTVKKF